MSRNVSTEKKKAYIQLHIAVLFFGLTAILGDLISLTAIPLVWWRLFLSCIALFFFFGVHKHIVAIPSSLYPKLILIGAIVGIHWITFFAAIKVSNASIVLICLSTLSLITAILEPLFFKQKHVKREILLGLLVIPGMVLIVNELDLSMRNGVVLALISTLLGAIFVILNRKVVEQGEPYTITFIELFCGLVVLSIALLINRSMDAELKFIPNRMDWVYLGFLAVVCTCIAYTFALKSLKHLSAFVSNLAVNLEPVYGMLLAALILNEDKDLTPKFYLGSFIIVISIFIQPIYEMILHRKNLQSYD